MSNLFEAAAKQLARQYAPLAERVRPKVFADLHGQDSLVGPAAPLRQAIESDQVPSMILWGPPGCGKTTLARVIANESKAHFVEFSAVTSGVKEARAMIESARERLYQSKRRTILFVDEIHRFNKAQQDAFLPHVENGTVILVGATTENPSFEINAALRSRCRVFVLEQLSTSALTKILTQALANDATLANVDARVDLEALTVIAHAAGGDARDALANLEWVIACWQRETDRQSLPLDAEFVREVLPQKVLIYDKSGDQHYDLISALHKSIRDSDPQGALYWFARMVESGEDCLYLARRLVRIASEDIGLADPQAIPIAIAAKDAYHFLGSPEGELALAELVVYLATAPKSNRIYTAFQSARAAAREHGPLPVPKHLRNAPSGLMKSLGYGKGYQYAHDQEHGITNQAHLPDELKDRKFYEPGPFGFEKDVQKRLAWWQSMRQRKDATE